MEEKKKKNKGLIVAIVILILLVLGLGGYIVYDKVLKEAPKEIEQPKETIEEVNFYDVSELVKNKYIKKIENTYEKDSRGEKTIIEIKDNKVYVADMANEIDQAKGIEGTPKYVGTRHYAGPYNYIVLTEEGDLYYSSLEQTGEDGYNYEFDKINTEKVNNVYVMYEPVTPGDYINIYSETEDGKLINYITSKTFEEENPYPDTISAPGYGSANPLYISPTRELYNQYIDEVSNGYEEIKYNNQSLKIKDGFSIVKEEIDEDGETELVKTTFYLITEDNMLYELTIKKEEGNLKYQDIADKVKLHSDKKIAKYIYNKIEKDEYTPITYDVTITYENSNENFKNVYAISTLYERYNK